MTDRKDVTIKLFTVRLHTVRCLSREPLVAVWGCVKLNEMVKAQKLSLYWFLARVNHSTAIFAELVTGILRTFVKERVLLFQK